MGTLGNINNPSEINSLGQFLALLDVTQKNSVRILGAANKSAMISKNAVIYGLVLISRGII